MGKINPRKIDSPVMCVWGSHGFNWKSLCITVNCFRDGPDSVTRVSRVVELVLRSPTQYSEEPCQVRSGLWKVQNGSVLFADTYPLHGRTGVVFLMLFKMPLWGTLSYPMSALSKSHIAEQLHLI